MYLFNGFLKSSNTHQLTENELLFISFYSSGMFLEIMLLLS